MITETDEVARVIDAAATGPTSAAHTAGSSSGWSRATGRSKQVGGIGWHSASRRPGVPTAPLAGSYLDGYLAPGPGRVALVIVLDASVLIAHLDWDDARHDRAATMLTKAAGHPLVASAITLAEIMVGPARTGPLDVALSSLADLAIAEVPIQAGAAVRVAG